MNNKPKRIVLCLDGTWNNAYQMQERDDGTNVLKPSNPLKMARAVAPWDQVGQTQQITYYDTGVGSLGKYVGLSNRVVGFVDNTFGGAWGAGFEANIEQAATFLANNYSDGDQVFIFGFSRGAAQARGLTHFIDWLGGIPAKSDAYFVPLYFLAYLESGGLGNPHDVTTSSGQRPGNPIVPARVELLGVWDTAMALGSRFRARKGTSVDKRSFHVGTKPARCVLHARQALAVDEKRYDFRPEIWLGYHEGQTLEQRWFPGVHSNIGGGYIEDGLANIAFQWMLGEAQALGLAVDRDFTGHYRAYPQAKLNESMTPLYKTLDFIRLRRGRGVRSLLGYPKEARLSLDKSVIHRIRSDPSKHEQLDRYRPENVREFLAAQTDLDAFLADLGLDSVVPPLPADYMPSRR